MENKPINPDVITQVIDGKTMLTVPQERVQQAFVVALNGFGYARNRQDVTDQRLYMQHIVALLTVFGETAIPQPPFTQWWVEGLDKSLLKIFDWPNIAFYSILSNFYALLDYNPKSKYDVPLFFIDDQLNNS